MAVAELVDALDCDSSRCGFESHRSPQLLGIEMINLKTLQYVIQNENSMWREGMMYAGNPVSEELYLTLLAAPPVSTWSKENSDDCMKRIGYD